MNFRRWITALFVMALFVGLASAQGVNGGSNGTFTCSVQNTVTPNLRSEGFTEQTGDIVLICSGGNPLALGSQIPTVNITVFYNVPAITSRLISATGATAPSGVNASEALLLIDEPDNNGPLATSTGYGPAQSQKLCSSPVFGAGPNGCVQYVGTSAGVPGVAVDGLASSTVAGANMFQGVVNGSAVTFFGIPVLPPVTSGVSRVYRITNVRVNANGAGGGVAGGPGQVNASISISSSGFLITNPNPIVGYISPGLKTSVGSAGVFNQCVASTGPTGVLNFTENFGSAFKTRVDGLHGGGAPNTTAVNNQTSAVVQNTPGAIYNSESNFVANGAGQTASANKVTDGSHIAGLADYGTRLKAVFSNIPAGVTVYVSTTNITSTTGGTTGTGAAPLPAATTTSSSYAVLLTSETAIDSDSGVPAATFTNTFTSTSSSGNASTAIQYVAFTSQGSPIVAVWEVVNTQPQAVETIQFEAFISYTGVTQTFPPTGTSQVALSFAPNPTNGAFSATNGGTTAVNNLIPRFADTSTNATFLTINICRTTLLFPYVTTVTGFTTGIAIANTTTDPFGTTNQQGTCALNWYQGSNNPAQTVTPNIPSGTVFTADVSGTSFASQGFTGYMIAVCNFQLAHGAAVIQDIGAQHILSTYLALVVPTGTNSRNISSGGAPEALNN